MTVTPSVPGRTSDDGDAAAASPDAGAGRPGPYPGPVGPLKRLAIAKFHL
jgi:hypothetical protein